MSPAPPYHPTRSGRDRRAGLDRRVLERRRRSVPVPLERRGGGERRDGSDRRSGRDRRRSWIGGRAVNAPSAAPPPPQRKLSARDRTKARMLPDDFLAASGDTLDRLGRVIRRKWANAPRPVRAGLAEGLVPILEPLRRGARPTEAVRDACEEVVATWLAPFRGD